MTLEDDERVRKVEIEEDEEGPRTISDDYFFDRIGKPIPITKDQSSSPLFSLDSPPTSCLAISERHRLIFIAHPLGFYVAKTKDVMDAAVEIESNGTKSSVQELCIVDVHIGKVNILSLSNDSSTLAVSVAGEVHFFAVDSLLNKELKPCFSCSLSESSALIKDIQWRRRSETSYLVLSNQGKLYRGTLGSPLKEVMDNVDAVEWSLNGRYIVVAREKVLHFFSSKFKERLRMTLPFKSWVGDSNDNDCSIKVDSIRWVRPDSIIVGCLQQTADGREENYLLQVIRSKDGKITDASSDLCAMSFYDSFYGLVDDIVPYGGGPYLCLSYLPSCGLAITANRKNTDEHIQLLHWSLKDDMAETAIIEIDRDGWLPRIELQGNGDDNLVMGLCVDKVSLYGEVKVEVGIEFKELSPFCVLLCVTLEGKLVMFNVASITGPDIQQYSDSTSQDEGEDFLSDIPSGLRQSNITSESEEQTLEQVTLDQLNDVSKRESSSSNVSDIAAKKDLVSSGKSENSILTFATQQIPYNSRGQGVGSLVNLKPSADDDRKQVLTKLPQATNAQQTQIFGQSSLKNLSPGPYFSQHSDKVEAQKISEIRSPAFSVTSTTGVPNQSNGKDLPTSVDLPKDSTVTFTSSGLQVKPSQLLSDGKVMFSGCSESRSQLVQGNKFDYNRFNFDTGSVPVDLAGKPHHLKDVSGGTTPTNFPSRSTQVVGQKARVRTETIDSLPSIRNSHLPSQESFALGKSAINRPYSSKDAYKASSFSNSEPHLSRQFGNIKEMAKDLDILLEDIEGPGGFWNACALSHNASVETFEECMQTLSEKCRMWRNMMDDQQGELQHLLDKTVQVLARKLYVEGIVKQASDSHYWELWNHQKLSSELELKRRHILKLNQVLTNQLIELERHFNALELHKFGENGGGRTGWRVYQSRPGSSRQIQSLHSLHNTTNSQLAAAEHLSECLSRQMAVLSVESPVKTRNVKKELFETIGIPYEATISSPDATNISDSSLLKKNFLSPGSAANKYHSRRRQSSAMKSSDSETARRRRDSLDQTWASFEPSKTTVKRVLLPESQKISLSKLSFMDRQHLGNSAVDGTSTVGDPKKLTSTSTFMHPSGNKGTPYMFPNQAFNSGPASSKLPNDSLSPSQFTSQATGLRSPMFQSDNAFSSSISASQALVKESGTTAHKLSGRVSPIGNSDYMLSNESKLVQQSETNLFKKSSASMELAAQTPVLMKSSEMLGSHIRGSMDTGSTIKSLNQVPTSTKGYDSSVSLLNTTPPSHTGKVLQFNTVASKTHPTDTASSSQAFLISTSFSSMPRSVSSAVNSSSIESSASSLSSTTSLSAATPFSVPSIGSKENVDADRKVSLTPSSSVSSVIPFSSFSFQANKSLFPLNNLPAVSESFKVEVQSSSGEIPLPVNPMHPSSFLESLKTEVQQTTSDTSLSISPTPLPSTSESPSKGPQAPAGKTSPSVVPTTSTSEPSKTQIPPSTDKIGSKTEVDTVKTATLAQPEHPVFSLKLEPPVSSTPSTEISTQLGSGNLSTLNMASSVQLNDQPKQPADGQILFGAAVASDSVTGVKNSNLDFAVSEEDEMEEEAPETSCPNEISLGSLGGFGLGSTPSSTAAPKGNPFGVSFGNTGSQVSSPFSMTVPSGELFRPASFSFSPQPSQPSPPANLGAFSGGFGAAAAQAPAPSGFGQPAQIGAGQQALGSVLGSFGQSRQLGTGFPGGFATSSSMGGFSSAATGGGFASAASTGGGFAGLASGGGGFASLASGGGGFAGVGSGAGGFTGMASTGGGFGGGFSRAASGGEFPGAAAGGGFPGAASGGGFPGPAAGGGFAGAAAGGGFAGAAGGFGAFNSQQGASGFSAFGGNAGAAGKPPELFTQMRK